MDNSSYSFAKNYKFVVFIAQIGNCQTPTIMNCSGTSIGQIPPPPDASYVELDISLCASLHNLTADDFTEFTALKVLYIRGIDSFELGEKLFEDLTALEKIDFTGSRFEELPEDLFFGLTNLVKIRGLHAVSLPANIFSGLGSLRVLQIVIEESSVPATLLQVSD